MSESVDRQRAIGAVLGVIVGVFASGVVLMGLGWVRLGKKLK